MLNNTNVKSSMTRHTHERNLNDTHTHTHTHTQGHLCALYVFNYLNKA